MSRYGPLRDLLQRRGVVAVEMTFDEIVDVVGGLPPSAYRHAAWWANNPQGHSHSVGWLGAGRRVEHVDLRAGRVRFSAPTDTPSHESAERRDADAQTAAAPRGPAGKVQHGGVDVDWASVWETTATAMREHIDAGRGHLLTEDVLRFAVVAALQRAGVDAARLRIEHRVPKIAASIDLVVDVPPAAVVELKYPRDPEMQGAADTMTHGEVLRDFYRLAWLDAADSWALLLLDTRLRGYLQRRSEVQWAWEPGHVTRLTPSAVAGLALTARRCLPAWTEAMTVDARLVTSLPVGDSLLLAYDVRRGG